MTTLATAPTTSAHAAVAQISLVGNPNTGKTALFNQLTGARQRVGNYPGVTVDKKVGHLRLGAGFVDVIDLPGTYSLTAISADERVVIDVLAGRIRGTKKPDLVVCVVDAANLMRNLFLASQVADTGLPMVIALNMWDAAEALGIHIHIERLSKQLGVPIVPTVGRTGKGVDKLKQAIAAALQSPSYMKKVDWPAAVLGAAGMIQRQVKQNDGLDFSQAEAMRLLFDANSAIAERLGWQPSQHQQVVAPARQHVVDAGFDPFQVESWQRYRWLGQTLDQTISFPAQRRATHTESIDNLLTHRFWGLILFAGIMYAVFWSIYTLAGPFMDAIDLGFSWLGGRAGNWLANTPLIQAMVVDGVINGVGFMLVFLPQILILFFFIALLEDTGYMARAAFLMDKLFSWCGLNGKSFIPLLGSYACAVPSIMGARTIEDPKARLTTILIAPLMSCSARLPVYVLMIGAFIEPRYGAAVAAFALFFMHVLGLIFTIPIAWILNRLVFRRQALPFILEMPPYRVPRWRDVLWRMYLRGREFVVRAGTVIFAMAIIIWALSYFPRPDSVRLDLAQQVADEQSITVDAAADLIDTDPSLRHALDSRYLEQSWLGRAGKAIQPVFAPAGFDWKITVGVISSFPARETIIATLGIIYNVGSDVDEQNADLVSAIKHSKQPDGSPVFTVPVALSVMVFFALCMQCGSTLAVIARESNWKWSAFAFTYMTVLAWVAAVATYQIGTSLMSTVT